MKTDVETYEFKQPPSDAPQPPNNQMIITSSNQMLVRPFQSPNMVTTTFITLVKPNDNSQENNLKDDTDNTVSSGNGAAVSCVWLTVYKSIYSCNTFPPSPNPYRSSSWPQHQPNWEKRRCKDANPVQIFSSHCHSLLLRTLVSPWQRRMGLITI